MNLQDRAFAAGMFVIMGICCLGAYVAVSGFLNASPTGLDLALSAATVASAAQTSIVLPETVAPSAQPLSPVLLSGTPTNTPKGYKPTATLLSRGTPSPAFLADIPTITPATPGSTPTLATSTPASGCGYAYCPVRGGPPDSRAPTGQSCPLGYLWGFVIDSNGRGQAGMQIQYSNPDGEGDKTYTNGPPDPAGRWDVPAGGGTWTFQLIGPGDRPWSPAVSIQAHVADPSGKTCPTRLDFRQ